MMTAKEFVEFMEARWNPSEGSQTFRDGFHRRPDATAQDLYEALPHPGWVHWLALQALPRAIVERVHIAAKAYAHQTHDYANAYCTEFRRLLPWSKIEPRLEKP